MDSNREDGGVWKEVHVRKERRGGRAGNLQTRNQKQRQPPICHPTTTTMLEERSLFSEQQQQTHHLNDSTIRFNVAFSRCLPNYCLSLFVSPPFKLSFPFSLSLSLSPIKVQHSSPLPVLLLQHNTTSTNTHCTKGRRPYFLCILHTHTEHSHSHF